MNTIEDERYSRHISSNLKDSLWMISELVRNASNVLDIGVGSGALGEYLTTKKNCKADGVEKIPAFADQARPYYGTLHTLDIESTSLTDAIVDTKYDYIILADVIEHLRDPENILRQIPTLMAKGGHLLLSVPNIGHAGVIAGLLSGQFEYRDDGLLDTTHVRFFTRSSLCDLLEKHGFQIQSITPLKKDISETEFREHFLDSQAPAVARAILAQPDALTYQFIVDATYNPNEASIKKQPKSDIAAQGVNELFFGCQLFWKTKDTNYSGNQCISSHGVIGKKRQSISFTFPDLESPPSKIRLDLSDRPGLINLFSIQLLSASHEMLWDWRGDMEYLAGLHSKDITFFPKNIDYALLLTGDDSQLELELPEASLNKVTGGASFVIEIGWPMNADFAAALDWVYEYHEYLEELLSESLLLQKENSILTNSLDDMKNALDKAINEITTLENNRADILASTSWRITKPLRLAQRLKYRLSDKFKVGLTRIKDKIPFVPSKLPEGLFGNLDSPAAGTPLKENFVNVSGWVFSSTLPVTKVFVTVNDSTEQTLTYGHSRPDVAQAYPDSPASIHSGFSGIVTLKKTNSNTIKMTLWIEVQGGAKIRCFSRDFIKSSSAPKVNLPLLFGFLVVSARKAWRAYRGGRLPMSPAAWWLGLKRNYAWMSWMAQDKTKFQFRDTSDLIQDPYDQWMHTNRITSKLERLMKSDAARVLSQNGSKISIVVPVYNTPQQFLEEMISSVITQYYENWELILVDDASPQPHVREALSKASEQDQRIKAIFRASNGHISEATNDGINSASGEFIALLDHDDLLPPDALLHVAEAISRQPDVDWIYTDEDKIDATGHRFDPQFKGTWNPEMAITHNYTHHLTVIRKSVVVQAGKMRKGYEGAQDLDLFLRVTECTTPSKVLHVPQICYHWRSHEESTASKGTQKTYIFDSARQGIQDALNRRDLNAEPFLPKIAQEYGLCLNQLRWKDSLGPGKEVTIVIPTKDRVDLLKRCITSLYKTCDKRFVKIIVMDDRSSEAASLKYFHELESDGDFECKIIRPKRSDGTFNYARLINEAAEHVDTPYFLQLNNDVEAIEPGWLEDMMGWLSVKGVGVVGARLLYPDQTVQHAGIVIGPHGGLADHQFHLLPVNNPGYLTLPHAARDVSAVTGACLLTTTELFRKMEGFDEAKFAVEYNDVDFCLRVIKNGQRVVYTPQATLTHLTSASRGKSFNPQEHINFVKQYKKFEDPHYSRSIRQDTMWMPVDGGRFTHVDRVKNIRILLISHALTLTGAPIVAYEFARFFSQAMGFQVSVLALEDGPIRQRYEEAGIPVTVIQNLNNIYQMNTGALQDELQKINNQFHIETEFDLVVCNTLRAFWGVLLADLSKVPSIWHIHESEGVDRFAATFSDPAYTNAIASSFLKASRIVFQANATRAIYGEFEANHNICTIPGGLPLERIEKFRLENSKIRLRQKYGIAEDDYVVMLIGTTCERKGQSVFLDAIIQMPPEALPSNVSFLMVGAIDNLYTDMLREKIAKHDLSKVQLVGETKDIYDYYGLGDLFVCASFEESFPMVVLLAMAFELPIVSTNVFGIPEIVSDQNEALLIEPGDSKSMAKAILQCIKSQDEAKAMAARAFAKAWRLFDNDTLLAQHADLAKKVATEDAHANSH